MDTQASVSSVTTLVLDDFENGNRDLNPLETEPNNRYLWSLLTDYSAGTNSPITMSTSGPHGGTNALQSHWNEVAEGDSTGYSSPSTTTFEQDWGRNPNWQLYCRGYINSTDATYSSQGWNNVRTLVTNSSLWQTNTFNRMKFWIKPPAGSSESVVGLSNFELGTFLRESSANGQTNEHNNWHWYHKFNFAYNSGKWTQAIVDMHPDHRRNSSGSTEHGNQAHPSTITPTLNYFDLMCTFYLDFPYSYQWGLSTSEDIYLDDVTFYSDQNNEDDDHIYSIFGTWISSLNKVRVGARRIKSDTATECLVRYAFSDIHALGWSSATVPAVSTMTRNGEKGNNGMAWESTAIDVGANPTLYVALKYDQSTETRIKQIAIPLT